MKKSPTRYLWTFSAVGFLVALLFSYAYLPEIVNFDGNQKSISEYSMYKDNYFFTVLGAFFLVAILVRGLGYLMEKLPVKNQAGHGFFISNPYKVKLVAWVITLGIFFNIFLIILLGFISYANYAMQPRFGFIGLFLYIAPALFILWFIRLVLLYLRRQHA